MTIQMLRAGWDYLLARFGVDPTRDEGLTTTEVAVLTFLLVGGAITVAAIIITAARDSADSIPQP